MFQLLYRRVLWGLIFSKEENELATKEWQKKKIEKREKKFPQLEPEKTTTKPPTITDFQRCMKRKNEQILPI